MLTSTKYIFLGISRGQNGESAAVVFFVSATMNEHGKFKDLALTCTRFNA